MSLSVDSINLSISVNASSVSIANTSTPMLLTSQALTTSPTTDRLRFYTSLAGLATDLGASYASYQVYNDAAALLSQKPTVQQFAVGYRAAAVAQTVVFTPSSTTAQTYKLVVTNNATGITTNMPFTGGATPATTLTNLVSAYTALASSLSGLTPAQSLGWTATSTSTTGTITAGTAGYSLTANVYNAAGNIDPAWVITGTANHGCYEDLNEIQAFNPNWYLVIYGDTKDDGHQRIIASWAETQQSCLFFAQAQAAHTAAYTTAASSATQTITESAGNVTMNVAANQSLADTFYTLKYNNSACFYHSIDSEGLAAAAAAILLSYAPASINMKYKQLTSITADTYTDNQVTILEGKSANGYRTEAGKSFIFSGTVAGTQAFIDTVYGVDALQADIQARIYQVLTTVGKVPYTQSGLMQLAGQVSAAIKNTEGKLTATSRVLSDGSTQIPAYTVTVPLISSISSTNRGNRVIPSSNPIVFELTLASGINQVNMTGTVSVT